MVAECIEWNGKDENVAVSMGLWDRQEDPVRVTWQGIQTVKAFLWVTDRVFKRLLNTAYQAAAEVDGGFSPR